MTPRLIPSGASTRIVTRAILERPDVLAEFAFETIGSATARTRSEKEAAERIAVFAEKTAGTRWMIERAPELEMLARSGALADVEWLTVVDAIREAVRRRRADVGDSRRG